MGNVETANYEKSKPPSDDLGLENSQQEERKVIQRAKEILMRQRNLDEDDAYVMLREMAMRKNMKLSALATQLIDAAKMLIV